MQNVKRFVALMVCGWSLYAFLKSINVVARGPFSFFIICPRPHDYSFKVIPNLVLFSSINTVRSLLDIHLTLDLAGLYFIVKGSDENIVNAKCSLGEKIGNVFIISLCLDYFCPFLVSWVLIHFSTICSVIQILASIV